MKNFTFQQGIEVHEHQFLDFADIRAKITAFSLTLIGFI